VSPWHRDRSRVTILVLIIILVISAIKGWALIDVAAVITAVGAVTAAGVRRATAS
jgi:hypothetical protein